MPEEAGVRIELTLVKLQTSLASLELIGEHSAITLKE